MQRAQQVEGALGVRAGRHWFRVFAGTEAV
jgi:hypothetical protein